MSLSCLLQSLPANFNFSFLMAAHGRDKLKTRWKKRMGTHGFLARAKEVLKRRRRKGRDSLTVSIKKRFSRR